MDVSQTDSARKRQDGFVPPLDQLGAEIVARIEAGDRANSKADDHYKAAGLQLVAARSRVADFRAFLKQHCANLKHSRAYQLMKIAGGKTTVEAERAKTAERVRKHRAARCPLRNGHLAKKPKRPTALDVIRIWMETPPTEDRRIFEAIGLRRLLAGIPDAWEAQLEEWVEERRRPPARRVAA